MPGKGKPFVKGDPRAGRPLGSYKEKSFLDWYKEICEEVAKENGKSVEWAQKMVYKVGYKKSVEGNYSFYKDMLDRLHGKPEEHLDLTTKGEPLTADEDRKLEIMAQELSKRLKENDTK